MNRHKRVALAMLVFALISWPLLNLLGLSDQVIVIVLSEVALAYPAVLALWFAEQEDEPEQATEAKPVPFSPHE